MEVDLRMLILVLCFSILVTRMQPLNILLKFASLSVGKNIL